LGEVTFKTNPFDNVNKKSKTLLIKVNFDVLTHSQKYDLKSIYSALNFIVQENQILETVVES
jgi:hypothetical protein